MPAKKSKSLPWDVVEKGIAKEIQWLKETIPQKTYGKYKSDYCTNCIFRQIAILIISGKIKARDIKSTISLWGEKKLSSLYKPHGSKEHAELMHLVASYFKTFGYGITLEPHLNMGRADVGVYKKGRRPLFAEVGTISLYKLLVNLKSMEGSDFLIVLSKKHVIEFSVLSSDDNKYLLMDNMQHKRAALLKP